MPDEDWVPWYRRKNYKGKMKEQEKRILDALRSQEQHPAARYEDLPEEVQLYISRLELELHDKNQEVATGIIFLAVFVSGALFYQVYQGYVDNPTLTLVMATAFLAFGIYRGVSAWKQADEELFPSRNGAPSPTQEGICQEWEIMHLTKIKREERLRDID